MAAARVDISSAIETVDGILKDLDNLQETSPEWTHELVAALKHHRVVLSDLNALVHRYGNIFTEENNFAKILIDCRSLVEKCSQQSRSRITATFNWRRLSGNKDPTQLSDQLSLETQKHVEFIVSFGFWKQPFPENANSWPSMIGDASSLEFERLFSELQNIRNNSKRERAHSSHQERQRASMELGLLRVWESMCQRAGLVKNGAVPRLPWQKILASPARNLHDNTPHATNSLIHNPPSSTQLLPVASVKLGRKLVNLRSWDWSRNRGTLEWNGDDEDTTLVHYVPPNAVLYPMHSAFGKQLQVRFHEKHRMVLKTQGKIEFDGKIIPEYDFATADSHKKFQEDLRGKILIHPFEIKWIRSQSSRKYDEAATQVLQLWLDDISDPVLHVLSFFATEQRVWEFPLLWFDDEITPPKKGGPLQLNFKTNGSLRPKLEKTRTFSFGRSKSAGQTPPRSKEKSVSALPDVIFQDMSQAQRDLVNDLGYLEISFEEDDNPKVFIEMFGDLYEKDAASLLESLPGSPELDGKKGSMKPLPLIPPPAITDNRSRHQAFVDAEADASSQGYQPLTQRLTIKDIPLRSESAPASQGQNRNSLDNISPTSFAQLGPTFLPEISKSESLSDLFWQDPTPPSTVPLPTSQPEASQISIIEHPLTSPSPNQTCQTQYITGGPESWYMKDSGSGLQESNQQR